MSAAADTPTPLTAEEQALERHREALRQRFPLPEPKPRKPRKTLIGAALALLLGVGVVGLDPAYQQQTYRSAVGEQRVLALADGSRIYLDSASQVEVSWHLRSRRVELHSGQALFEVSKAILRPFEVEADSARVRVLGTRFNVARFNDDVRVALAEGSIAIHSSVEPQRQLRLLPGQQVEVRQGHLQPVVSADLVATLAWQQQRLVFARTPLAEALAHVQRYRQAPVRLDDPGLASLPITGVFNSDKVEDLLDILPGILPLSLTREADGTVHISRRAGKK